MGEKNFGDMHMCKRITPLVVNALFAGVDM